VYGSNKADLNLKEFKSDERGSFPCAFHPQPMDARRLEPKSKALVVFIQTHQV